MRAQKREKTLVIDINKTSHLCDRFKFEISISGERLNYLVFLRPDS
jgi:hypothetical protein